ncbi:hypothetical protein WMY93_001949 [Mugilogobius chulae]|uniref:Claudin n=1 Tax=Mugilogobius chulae TaxID=88201 RepID=A0AAW0PTE6_9GOBI
MVTSDWLNFLSIVYVGHRPQARTTNGVNEDSNPQRTLKGRHQQWSRPEPSPHIPLQIPPLPPGRPISGEHPTRRNKNQEKRNIQALRRQDNKPQWSHVFGSAWIPAEWGGSSVEFGPVPTQPCIKHNLGLVFLCGPVRGRQMGSSGVQIVCVALGVLGLVGVIVCCAIPRWTMSSFVGSNIVTAQTTYKGIWMECVMQSTGQQQCKSYDSLLVLPSDLQAARALTIISAMIAGLALLILFCGADFTTCIENEDYKPKICLISGIALIVAGVLVIIPASWSAHTVVREFNNPILTGQPKMELGPCIFIGWAAGVLLLIAGGLLCCFSRSNSGSGHTAKYYSNSASAPKNYV